jgi:hypothetical protein
MASTNPFDNIGFEDFRKFAKDPSLSKYERIGFPDSYRKGLEPLIFEDIRRKLTQLDRPGASVLDIGPGCSDLPGSLIAHCREKSQRLTLIDSQEMLALLPTGEGLEKVAARFPDCPEVLTRLRGKVDALLSYSVLHYVHAEGSVDAFLDAAFSLLAPGGQMLLGDIPNLDKRRRFFASEAGVRFHQKFMGTDEPPQPEPPDPEGKKIGDAAILAILQRARRGGFDAYVVPQDPALPMANRREDILVTRP